MARPRKPRKPGKSHLTDVWKSLNAKGVTATVSKDLIVDVSNDSLLAARLAAGFRDAARSQLSSSTRTVSAETRARRERSRKSPDPNRYHGRMPNPSGPYGRDSGYLEERVRVEVRSGGVALTTPASRTRAIYATDIKYIASALFGHADKTHVPMAVREIASGVVGTEREVEAARKKMLRKVKE